MVDAAKTSKTSVFVGNGDYLVTLAEDGGDDRWIRSMSLGGGGGDRSYPHPRFRGHRGYRQSRVDDYQHAGAVRGGSEVAAPEAGPDR